MSDWARPSANSNEYRGINIAKILSGYLTWLAISVLFLVSPMVLFQWGSSYEEVGGNALEKVHPGSFLVTLALFFQLIAIGSWQYLFRLFFDNKGVAIFIATTFLLVFYAIFVQKIPFTPIIDTFGLPIITFILLLKIPRLALNQYAIALHAFFALNALLALYEYSTGNRLTPYVAGTLLVENDWRSTAFLGHPLNNAMLTGAYILLLIAKNGAGLTRAPRAALLLLQFGAMIAFGARASLVLTLLLGSLILIKNAATLFAGKMRLSLPFMAIIALCIPILAVGLFALDEIGFFDRLIERFSEDKGSANARIAMLQLFNYIPFRDVLWGPDPDLIETLKGIEGVEAGIESVWVAFVLTYGLIMSSIFFIGVFAFCLNVARRTQFFTLYVFLFFFLVASTSVSLSAKTSAFGMLIIMVFVFQNNQQETQNAYAKY
jgi:hypothetical protein